MNIINDTFPLAPVSEHSYISALRLGSRDVNLFCRLRTSAMFELFQEISGKHADILGFGSRETQSRKLAWVIIMQRAEIERMPVEGELIYLETWIGKTSHLLYPRFYRICDESGNILIRASSLWTLMDIESRSMINSEPFAEETIDMTNGSEIPLPSAPKKAAGEPVVSFTVPYSFLDQNGHMNNTRYFDLAEDIIPAPLDGKKLRTIVSRYANEARHGDVIELRWQELNGIYRISGGGDKKYFSINLEYYGD